MKNLGEFYIPSFFSASKGTGFSDKMNTTIIIDASEGERITLDIPDSEYAGEMSAYASEKEVLIAAYSKYKFDRVEEPTAGTASVGNPRKLYLKLKDPMEEHGEILDLYHDAKFNRWDKLFAAMDKNRHKAALVAKYVKPTSKWTALHQAAYWGNQSVAEKLVSFGADCQRKSIYGETPQAVKRESGVKIDWEKVKSCRTEFAKVTSVDKVGTFH